MSDDGKDGQDRKDGKEGTKVLGATSITDTPAVSGAVAARLAAEGAGRAAQAAAENAAKTGMTTSEFKVTLGAIGLAALMGALKALSVIPGPWQIPAAVVLGAAVSAGAYSMSRGKVKVAALAALAPMVAVAAVSAEMESERVRAT